MTAYGPQPSRRWYVVIAAINYEDSSRRSLLAHPPDHRIRGLIDAGGVHTPCIQRRTVRLARSSCVSPVVASNTASRAWGSKPQWEFPRLCRGGSKSLTYPAVDTVGPSTKLRIVSSQAHEEEFHRWMTMKV